MFLIRKRKSDFHEDENLLTQLLILFEL
jgi:hypothetical protein